MEQKVRKIALHGTTPETIAKWQDKLLDYTHAGVRLAITLRNSVGDPLTNDDIVLSTLAYANGATLEFSDLPPRIPILNRITVDWWTHEPGPRELTDLERRDQTKNTLGLLLDDSPEVDGWIAKNTYYLALGMSPKIVPALRSGRVRLTHHYDFTSQEGVAALGVLLLADETFGYRKRLCECHHSVCGAFFLERRPETGRPQRLYCCKEHGALAHVENGPRRMARLRKSRITTSMRSK
jgi:hypothetical protein